jgi:histidyl-tRNA synthetase
MQFERVKGTYDMLGKHAVLFKNVTDKLKITMEGYGFSYAQTAVLQPMEMFKRAVGNETDIVNKEMFEIKSKSGKEYVLKPEETAPLMRSVIESNFVQGLEVKKLYYITPLFRHERPQKGRFREFYQYGVETLNSSDFRRDCELIMLGEGILKAFEIKKYNIEINSIGCRTCRPEYTAKLKKYFSEKSSGLCKQCRVRLDSNPLRVLDCKESACKIVASGAPKMIDSLCEECKTDFERVKGCLDEFKIDYTLNPMIVRGLDYYTKTVFEFIETGDALGSQSTLIGGGRYDMLSKELGGQDMPSCGFAGGIERLILSIPENIRKTIESENVIDAFIVHFGKETAKAAFSLTESLRQRSIRAEILFETDKIKKQLSLASGKARLAVIIGEEEIKDKTVLIKNLADQKQEKIEFNADKIAEYIKGVKDV